MSTSRFPAYGRAPSAPLLVDDLSARLAPLDLYGLAGLDAAVVDALRRFAGPHSPSGRGSRCLAD